MIKKLFISFILFFIPLLVPMAVHADSSFVIEEFRSEIILEKDAHLTVKEMIKVNFFEPRHGIFRAIPIFYKIMGRTIKADFKAITVVDEKGNGYRYDSRRESQYVKLRIGDPDTTITGPHTYVITYEIDDVVQRYEDYDEVFWNVTGSEWNTDILRASAILISPHAKISKVECFAGAYGGNDKFCKQNFNQNSASFSATSELGLGRDFTIVVALDKDNELIFPGRLEKTIEVISDNWGYFIATLPIILILYFWFKKGRDLRFIGDNVYYDGGKGQMTKPLFAREHLPTVYYPIQELTPSELGTIVDEKVDIDDVVAEIVELARLKYLKIEKLSTKKLIFKSNDYKFVRLKKEMSNRLRRGNLSDYQVYLLNKLFEDGNEVRLSSLKNKFYKHLEEFKKKLYTSLADEAIFDGAPDKIRTKWIGIFICVDICAAILIYFFLGSTGNFFPFIVLTLFSVPGFFTAYSMPRRTARGYSFYRQIKGLNFYLEKGKWREEIAEKHLFFEEMLPIAIALGIVNKLSKDMEELGVRPPDYFTGITASTLASDMRGFSASTASNLMSAPGGKGGSWSGGSGFSGGSSGGGFGGGGGGSW